MSWLVFNRKLKRISLFEGRPPAVPHSFVGPPIASWPAHNETASNSGGSWPSGIYKWSHYNLHRDMGLAPACYDSAYGCEGIHVFSVKGRSGLGVHAGRTLGQPDVVGKKTLGCIRVPANAMGTINRIHIADPLIKIEVN